MQCMKCGRDMLDTLDPCPLCIIEQLQIDKAELLKSGQSFLDHINTQANEIEWMKEWILRQTPAEIADLKKNYFKCNREYKMLRDSFIKQAAEIARLNELCNEQVQLLDADYNVQALLSAKAEIARLKAIIGDVQNSRKSRYIGVTGGGNMPFYYPVEDVDEAIAGLGKLSKALKG